MMRKTKGPTAAGPFVYLKRPAVGNQNGISSSSKLLFCAGAGADWRWLP